jgi:hypothetical protein
LKGQKQHVQDCALTLHKKLISDYGDKSHYRTKELELVMKDLGWPVKRNLVTKVKKDPLISHLMFLSFESVQEVYPLLNLAYYLSYRNALGQILFSQCSELSNEERSQLVCPDGFTLIYRAKMFALHKQNDMP